MVRTIWSFQKSNQPTSSEAWIKIRPTGSLPRNKRKGDAHVAVRNKFGAKTTHLRRQNNFKTPETMI